MGLDVLPALAVAVTPLVLGVLLGTLWNRRHPGAKAGKVADLDASGVPVNGHSADAFAQIRASLTPEGRDVLARNIFSVGGDSMFVHQSNSGVLPRRGDRFAPSQDVRL